MSTEAPKYRLLTRSDFDGLVCAVLLKELDMLGDIKFVHPKDMQDGVIEVTDRDILTNVPFVDGCHLCFDHHASEASRIGELADNHVLDPQADSAARVVYEFFGGQNRFPRVSEEIMTAVDKADSAKFTREEILHPEGWVLLSFLMDARTGLGRFHDFGISNYELMMQLIDFCRDHTIDEILALPDVEERVDLYRAHEEPSKAQLVRCSTVHDNLVVLDLRDERIIYATNRFMIYSLFPECNISIHVLWGKQRQNTVFTIGKSILDRSCTTHVGELCLQYNGGGHAAAGTCQVAHEDAKRVQQELIQRINADAAADYSSAREAVADEKLNFHPSRAIPSAWLSRARLVSLAIEKASFLRNRLPPANTGRHQPSSKDQKVPKARYLRHASCCNVSDARLGAAALASDLVDWELKRRSFSAAPDGPVSEDSLRCDRSGFPNLVHRK